MLQVATLPDGVTIETFTPERAKTILAITEAAMKSGLMPIHQRLRSPRKVDEYAKTMKDGEWKLNGETVIFSPENWLLDGQHRLHACVQAGVPFITYVARNVDCQAFYTIDTGRRRNDTDIGAIAKKKTQHNAASVTMAAKLLYCYENRNKLSTTMFHDKKILVEVIKKYEDELEANHEFLEKKSLLRPVQISFNIGCNLYCYTSAVRSLFAERHPENLLKFWQQFVTGANLDTTDTVYKLRKAIWGLFNRKTNAGEIVKTKNTNCGRQQYRVMFLQCNWVALAWKKTNTKGYGRLGFTSENSDYDALLDTFDPLRAKQGNYLHL